MVVLLDGLWEWIIEFMRERMQLDSFDIAVGPGLLYSSGDFYRDHQYDGHQTVQNYVVHGGRHPSIIYFSDDETEDDEEKDEYSWEHGQHDGRNRHVKKKTEKDAEAAVISQRYSKELDDFLASQV